MVDRARLEAELRDHWGPDTLAVYADHLQAAGDPRGELIAIALRIDAGEDSPELRAHRAAVLERWLGRDAEHAPSGETGFVPMVGTSQVMLLATPLGEFARGLDITGSYTTLTNHLRVLGGSRRPWFERLVLHPQGEPRAPDEQVVIMNVCAQVPYLRSVYAKGGWLSGFAAAPRLAELELDFAALTALADSREVLDSVTLVRVLPNYSSASRFALPPEALRAQLPAVVRIDATHRHIGREAVLEWLASTELVRQLERVDVPAPRGPEDIRRLERIRSRFDGRLEVACAYAKYPFTIANVVTPPLRPWPPVDELVPSRLELTVRTDTFVLDKGALKILVTQLEHLADLDTIDVTRWTTVFQALVDPSRPYEMPLGDLRVAVAGTVEYARSYGGTHRLADWIERLDAPDTTPVQIEG